MESSLRIVAITNCPAGIAHTYMVAEALEQKARSLGHTIKVETQGSSGVENRLSSEEIAAADYVILATGRGLSGDDRARFAGKKVYEIAISQALKNIDQIFSELPTNSQLFAADSRFCTASFSSRPVLSVDGFAAPGESPTSPKSPACR